MGNDLEYWRPRNSREEWRIDSYGGRVAEIYTAIGVVKVYSFKGDEKTKPFTRLQGFVFPRIYLRSVNRHYSDRWIVRLASKFARDVRALAKDLNS
jgi:hypothetical protein